MEIQQTTARLCEDSLQSSPNDGGVLLHIQSLDTEKEISNLKGNYKTKFIRKQL